MTKIKFFGYDGVITGFEITGHSTSSVNDNEGKIVCSAVSSAAYLTANTLIEVIGADVNAKVGDGFMKIELKSLFEDSQITLQGFLLHAKELSKQYRNYIKVYSEV